MNGDRLLPLREVARRLGMGYRTVQRYVATGRLPTVRTISGYHRVRESALAAWLPADAPSTAAPVTRSEAQIPAIPTHAPAADRSMAGNVARLRGGLGGGQITRSVQTDRKW